MIETGNEVLLKIENLSVSFTQYTQGLHQIDLPVIRSLNVSVRYGEITAVVGASGSGKSLLAHTLLGILPDNCDAQGTIHYKGELLDADRIRDLRGKEIILVPQSVTYLDPLEMVGAQVRNEREDAKTTKRQQTLFDQYKLPLKTALLYPFELSGGMARRVFLSIAMMDMPLLIIADEPTPGLHPEAAKNALRHFREFADKGNGVLLITHDIDLALDIADRIAVFYAGTTVEQAPVSDFRSEDTLRHPYTKALWHSLPQNGFTPWPGNQPYVKEMPDGCPYAPRCPEKIQECCAGIPERMVRNGTVRCIQAT